MPSFAEAHASLLETGFETSIVEALERSTLPLTRSIAHGRSCGFITRADGNTIIMAKYLVNTAAVAHCRKLINAHQYVISSDWGDMQPSAEQQNDYLDAHSWADFSLWHLGLTSEAADETKARYAFVYGDLRRVHRSGLIACVYRAAEWDHKDVELAAHDLLQHLDRTRA